jgi:transposase-like protein
MHEEKNMPETSREYCAHGGTHCPHCGSDDIEGGSIQIDAATAWQPITCNTCGKKWNDIYTIAAYEPVK